MAKIISICISEKKGTQKTPVESATFKIDHGIVGDAHAGDWHRQVSLLAVEKVDAFRSRGASVSDGDFGENLVIEGIDLSALPVGTQLKSGEVVLEVTQIGKACHKHCAIYHQVGDCIMPREGIFAKVICEGTINGGDTIEIVES